MESGAAHHSSLYSWTQYLVFQLYGTGDQAGRKAKARALVKYH